MKTRTTIIYSALAPFAFACFALLPQARAACQNGCDIGNGNTFLGEDALINNTTGEANTAVGSSALLSNTEGGANTATGLNALYNNLTGFSNTATGSFVLQNNTTGSQNTAMGTGALAGNTEGNNNTANGVGALQNNTTGSNNTAVGISALQNNIVHNNTAVGAFALTSNTTGDGNTAAGNFALFSNTTGVANVAIGVGALQANTVNGNCVAIGAGALSNSDAGPNIGVGINAGGNLTTGAFNIDIGNPGVASDANTIRIGEQGTQRKTFIAGISGTGVTGRPVMVNGSGRLGVAPSSARFKQEIQSMDKASEAIHGLKPVTFHYKPEIDPEGVPQFGLVAEDVERVNPHLVARDAEGKVYTVRYEAVNAMLLNEFLKEHRKVEQQDRRLDQQETIIAKQQKQIDALTAVVQKVSAQLELSKPAPQTVLNNR